MKKYIITCLAPHKENWERFCQYELSYKFCAPKNEWCPYFSIRLAPTIRQSIYYMIQKPFWWLRAEGVSGILFRILHPIENRKINQEVANMPKLADSELRESPIEWWNKLPQNFKDFCILTPMGQERWKWKNKRYEKLLAYKDWLKRNRIRRRLYNES